MITPVAFFLFSLRWEGSGSPSGTAKSIADEHSLEVRWCDSNEIMLLDKRGNLPEILQQFNPNLPLLSTEQISL